MVGKQEYGQSEAAFNQAAADVKAAEANVQNLTAQQKVRKDHRPVHRVITTRSLDAGRVDFQRERHHCGEH